MEAIPEVGAPVQGFVCVCVQKAVEFGTDHKLHRATQASRSVDRSAAALWVLPHIQTTVAGVLLGKGAA